MQEHVKISWTPQLEDGAEEEASGHGDSSIEVAVAIVTVSFLVSFVWSRVRSNLARKKPFSALPMPPDAHWLFGLVSYMIGQDFISNQEHLYQKYSNENGQVGFYAMWTPVIGITHWEDAVAICNAEITRENHCLVYKHTSMVLGSESLFLANGVKWRLRHSNVKKALSPGTVASCREAVDKMTDTPIKSIEDHRTKSEDGAVQFQLEDLVSMITIDVFFKVVFSFELSSSKNLIRTPFAQAIDHLSSGWARRLCSPPASFS